MTTINEGRHPGEFLLSEANFHRSRDAIVIASGAGKIAPGTVLGRITSTGKFIVSPVTAVTGKEGAEKAAAIALHGVDATDADVEVAAITRDAEVKGFALTFDASVSDDAKKAAKATQIAVAGIIVR